MEFFNHKTSNLLNDGSRFAALWKNIPPSKRLSRPQEKSLDPESESESRPLCFLPGLDMDEGVRRIGGRWDRYLAILQKFCRAQQNFSDGYRYLVKNGNFEAARDKAHSLNGAAGNLSAIELKKAAQALEDASSSKDKSQMLRHLTAVEQALDEVIASVEKLKLADKASVARGPARGQDERSQLSALLSRFNRGLQNFDLVASGFCLKELKACIVSFDCRPVLKNLEAQIMAYDFDGAQKTLISLSERLDV